MVGNDVWAPLVERFVDDHYGSLRGRIRTRVIDAHLREHLPPPPASVVDVGGGAGTQSLPLARDGYRVTILDSSPAMLERATAALAAEPPEVAERVRLVEAGAMAARAALGQERFAAVLCHGVIMYIDDPAPFTAALVDLADPGGVVSIVAKNAASLPTRAVMAGDWARALGLFGEDREMNALSLPTRGDTVEGLTALLAGRRAELVAWYGVRVFTDLGAPVNGAAEDDVFAVELRASHRDPYRRLSRLFHLIGRRNAA